MTETSRSMHLIRCALALSVVITLTGCGDKSAEQLIAAGKAHAAKGDHRSAVIEFKSALQADARSASARILLGQSLLASGNAAGAAVELSKALDQQAPAADVLPSLARALVLSGQYKRLVDAYGDLKLDNPVAQANLKVQVATAWGALGDREKTEAAAAAAAAAAPDDPQVLLLKARLVAGRRDFDGALKLLDQIAERGAKLPELWVLKGEILEFQQRDSKAAEAAHRKALELDPSSVLAYAALISSRVRQRDVAGAKELATQLRKVAPVHPHTLLVEAQVAYMENRLDRSRELTQKLLTVAPNNPSVLILAGASEYGLGQVTQAAAHFGKAMQLYPNLHALRANLAEAEIRLGQYSGALETLRPLLAMNPPRPEALSLAGDASLRLGNPAEAQRYFLEAARQDPSNVRRQTTAAVVRLSSGDAEAALAELQALSARSSETYADEALLAAQMRRMDHAAALNTLNGLLKKRPNHAPYVEMRGRVHLARADFAGARAAFEEALKLDPALVAAVVNLAVLDARENKLEQGVQRLQTSIESQPKSGQLHVALADLLERQGRPVDEVRRALAQAITVAPSEPMARLQLIEYLLGKRLFKEALAASQEAVAALPNDSELLLTVGNAQLRAGDVEQAITTTRRYAAAVPNSPQPYLLLAQIYSISARPGQAEAALKQALTISPALPAAQNALVDLYLNSRRQAAAVEYIASLKRARPGDHVPYIIESVLYTKLKDNEAVVRVLQEGLARAESPELVIRLLGHLFSTGKQDEARRVGEKWLAKRPKDTAVELILSMADISSQDLKGAERRLRRIVAVEPQNAAALNNLAWVTVQLGGSGAVEIARRAHLLAPERADFMDTLASALAYEKQLAPALEMQRRAVARAPGDHLFRFHLAQLAFQAGDKALAKEELSRLQALGPKFKEQAEVSALLARL
ncbi:XrtA/PEP-CTERM system TPR-repeat protein PrsT [Rubrivivax rivuli]|uniref:PEP-CTERM system TPR-repeat protein PrsT n=1 Tax=Rubrivivax rivuli TaxID=1862385 RepID=A0A437RSR9_9BURK|nr:XrtA/PEP-CTERM system TPR-repeat protein PrsT [Rubrivivax rivuli]RVU49809.1 PEP-CTERM system TPR-repeat protein PrsT [Rubrivivax rivuli]